jgi:hypothetical protein
MTAAALLIVPVFFMIAFAIYCAIDGTTTHSARTSDNPEVIRYTANGKVTNGSLMKR